MDSKAITRELKELLENNLGRNIKDVILFGSQFTGKNTENSDIDILIILKNNYNWKYKRKINDLCYDLDLKYDVFLDTEIISEDELKNSIRGKHPIYNIAIKQGYHA